MASEKNGNAQEAAVRGRLLGEALELFTSRGYAATTVREIVAAAGVTKPVLYYYFGSKEGIYLELMRTAFAQFEPILDDCRHRQGSVTARLRELCDRIYLLFVEELNVARLMYAIYYCPAQGAPFYDFEKGTRRTGGGSCSAPSTWCSKNSSVSMNRGLAGKDWPGCST